MALPVFAQTAPPGDAGGSRPNPSALPTDVTPLIFTGERGLLSREMKFNLLRHLPERMWFNASTEVSQRLETNPAFVERGAKSDYVFRVLPNITVGYDVFKKTSVYANYFVIKDVFARFNQFTKPTIQSVSMGVRRSFVISRKASGQVDLQARELWQASHLHQFDYLPSVSFTYMATPRVVLFASSILQLRGGEYFVAPNREIDPFYSAGILLRKGQWNLVLTDTFVTNFRHPPFAHPIPRHGNVSMIADCELSRPLSNKYLPGVVGFLRAEPVWNWRSANLPGLSGFDFRLFSGIRIALNKPSYHLTIDRMRQQIIEYDKKLKSQPQLPGQGPSTSLPEPAAPLPEAAAPDSKQDQSTRTSDASAATPQALPASPALASTGPI